MYTYNGAIGMDERFGNAVYIREGPITINLTGCSPPNYLYTYAMNKWRDHPVRYWNMDTHNKIIWPAYTSILERRFFLPRELWDIIADFAEETLEADHAPIEITYNADYLMPQILSDWLWVQVDFNSVFCVNRSYSTPSLPYFPYQYAE